MTNPSILTDFTLLFVCYLLHPSIHQPKHLLLIWMKLKWTNASFILMNDDEMNEWINHENDDESINLHGLRFTFHLLYFTSLNLGVHQFRWSIFLFLWMTKIQMDKWWNHANNDDKLIHLGGQKMNWLIFKLIDSTHCQIDLLAFSFIFRHENFPNHEAIYCCIPFLSLSFLFLFLVSLTSVPFAHFCKIAVKSVGLFCLLYFFSSKLLLLSSLEAWLPPLQLGWKKV